MGFADAVRAFFSNYTNFSSRSSRSEYWWPQLAFFLVGIVIGVLSVIVGETIGNVLIGLFYLVILIPAIAVSVRRLHDKDKSGWWILIGLVPIVGGLYLLYLYVTPGTEGPNRFGPNPLGPNVDTFN